VRRMALRPGPYGWIRPYGPADRIHRLSLLLCDVPDEDGSCGTPALPTPPRRSAGPAGAQLPVPGGRRRRQRLARHAARSRRPAAPKGRGGGAAQSRRDRRACRRLQHPRRGAGRARQRAARGAQLHSVPRLGHRSRHAAPLPPDARHARDGADRPVQPAACRASPSRPTCSRPRPFA
jgi:hypothetical protein